ncbi:MAG: hypothetical protein MK089_09340 [Phycisphaerales bacterium]|nr:hypothetical protein [Phycisphaerales bacterium]
MSKQANVASIESLEIFRKAVLEFRAVAQRGLSGINHDVSRLQHWVGSEQPMIWRARLRKLQAAVDNARSDLERARISRPDDSAHMLFEQRKALDRARAKQREAEERLEMLNKWARRLDHQAMIMRSGLQPLSTMLDADMDLLVARLGILIKHLDSYLRLPAPPTDFDAWARDVEEDPSLARSGESTETPTEEPEREEESS